MSSAWQSLARSPPYLDDNSGALKLKQRPRMEVYSSQDDRYEEGTLVFWGVLRQWVIDSSYRATSQASIST